MKKKTYRLQMKETSRKWFAFLLIALIISFLLTRRSFAAMVVDVVKPNATPTEKENLVNKIQYAAIGTTFLIVGALFLKGAAIVAAVPVIPVLAVVVGLGLLAAGAYYLWSALSSKQPKGTGSLGLKG